MSMPQRTADKLATHSAYSYRNDPNVPPFPDDHPVIVHDGVCVLCSRSMRIIARGDRAGRFRFMSAQSATGQALYKHYDLDAQDFETVLLIESGRVYGKLDMIQHVAGQLSGPYLLFSALAVMRLLPGRVQDWCYGLIARNRYAWFGRTDVCMLPDESWRARVIE